MKIKSIAQFLVFSTLTFTAISCEQDFTEMGAEVIDGDQFGFEKYLVQNISTTNNETGVANTRNLPVNSLGVYTHSAFGKTKAHFVTQIEMKNNTDLTSFGNNPVLDSVYVYIPFTSTVSATDSEGNRSYNVSNLYGNGKFTLNVYENGYFLRTTDPNNNFDTQFYYENDKNLFDQNKKGLNGTNRLNNATSTSQNTEFSFNKNEIKLYAYNADGTLQQENGKPKVKERKAPGIWLDLDKNYFQQKFFANNKHKSLLNNGLLKEYFRGLYFEVEDTFNQNALAQLNLSNGKLVFVYKQDGAIDSNTNQPKRERKTYEFNIGYNDTQSAMATATTVNLLESNFDFDNNSVGNIWLKGGAKSTYATLSLFGNDSDNSGKADELENIINKKWLVNQALLTLYVDHTAMGLDTIGTPKQLYLYDYKNNKVIADYLSDASTTGKPIFGGFLNKTNKSVHKYQFRLTDHINNLITKDSTNVPLGLVVANDINLTAMNPLKATTKKTPLTAIMNPFGTIIHGPNSTNSDLKMKLEIYYTKEN